MAEMNTTASVQSQAGPSRTPASGRSERHDPLEGVGKFKLNQVKGNRYKDRFHVLREKYDTVTAAHEGLRRELEHAHAKLRKLQAENDLLLDAMQIVVTSQPRLNEIYQTISPASGTVPLIINANGREVIELPRGHAMSMPMPMAVDPEPIKHEHILNGNALGMEINPDVSHPEYSPVQEMNGR